MFSRYSNVKSHTGFREERSMAMSSIGRNEYITQLRIRYVRSTKRVKGQLLDEAVLVTGMHRKALVRVIRAPWRSQRAVKQSGAQAASTSRTRHRRGPKPIYDAAFHTALLSCWHAANDICAERLQPFLPELVPQLEACGELETAKQTRELLLQASVSTVARHLRQARRRSTVPLGTTKPGSLLKQQIAVRRGRWDETRPGWVETDTVAHGGNSGAGQFIFTYDFIDIATGWVELEAVMGKGERATIASLEAVRADGRFPFPLLGIDSDNGGEYINHHLMRYCKQHGISFTRSRPYQKNDNAHVEQKNWEAVRKMVGYVRLDTEGQLATLNELYRGPLRLYLNYFQPTRKRKVKETWVDTETGSKRIRKTYFEAMTPYRRVMEHPDIPQATKDMLQSEYSTLNPVKLLAEIHELLARLR